MLRHRQPPLSAALSIKPVGHLHEECVGRVQTEEIADVTPECIGSFRSRESLPPLVPDYEERTYYISGPPDMVRAYEHILKNMGVKQAQIKKDFFPGFV